jgi:hypothetical protein
MFFYFLYQLSQTEKEVEARLREKFALIDKSDVDQMNEAQKVSLLISKNKFKIN